MATQPSRLRNFKWSLDFSHRSSRGGDLPSPVGYVNNISTTNEISSGSDSNLRAKRSWDVALGPLKQLPMNLFIMYMSGNTISIFPIMMVVMMAVRPVKTLFSVNSTFKSLSSETGSSSNIALKFVFILGNLANVALAMYKCHSMGLLPTHASDWLAFADPIERMEWIYVAS